MDTNLSILVKFGALDRLTAPLRRMTGGAREAGKEMAAAKRQVLDLERGAARIGAYKDLQGQLATTAAKLGYARDRVAALQAAVAEGGKGAKGFAAQLLVAENAVTRFEVAERRQLAELDKVGRELGEAGVDVGHLADEEARLGRALNDTNRKLEAQREIAKRTAAADRTRAKIAGAGASMQTGGLKAIAGGAALGAPLAIGARSAITFESAMTDVKKVFNGTPEQFAALNRGVLELSKRTPVAAAGLAAIVAAGAQTGIQGPGNLLAYAESAAKMAVAFDMLPDEAGATMSAWRAAFGLTQAQAVILADKVNLLGNTSGASSAKVAAITTRIGPLGAVAGLASGEIAALGATLASMGIEEEIAATGIKNTMLALTKGTAATKDQKAAFKALGLESAAVSKSMQADAAGTIRDVMARIARLPKERQSGLLTQLFGSESVAAIAPLLTQLPRLEKNLQRVGDANQYAGSMQAEFLGVSGTSASKLQQMQNRVEAMKIVLGNRLLPMVITAADKIGALADRIGAFADRNPRAARAVMVLLSVLAGLMTTIGGVAVAVGTTLGPLSYLAGALRTPAASATLLQRALQMIFAPLRGGFALLARAAPLIGGILRLLLSPVAMIGRLLLAAIAPVVAAIGALSLPVIAIIAVVTALLIGFAAFVYNNWAGIKAFFASIWQSFMTATAPLRASLARLGAALGALGSAFLGWIGRAAAPFIAMIGRIGGAIASFFAPAVRWVTALVGPIAIKAWASAGALIGGTIGGIVNKLKGFVDWVTKGVTALTSFFNKGAEGDKPRRRPIGAPAPRLAGARAAGGPIAAGKLYLVGERGPEILQAPGNGTIIPNHRIGRKLAMAGAAASAVAALPLAAQPLDVRPDAPAVSASAPAAVTARRGADPRRAVTFTGPITIEIKTQPGQDAQAIADAVADALARRAVDEAAARDSSMADRED